MICTCNGAIANTGYLANAQKFGTPYGLLMVPLVANDGTRNSFDVSDPESLASQLLVMINNVDPSKRAYPLMGLENFVVEQATSEKVTGSNGSRFVTRAGITTLKAELWNTSQEFFTKVKDNCVEFGTFLVDTCGNIQGELIGDEFFPREVNHNSLDIVFQYASSSDVNKIMLEFDFDVRATNETQAFITADEFGVNNPCDSIGFLNVNFYITVVDSTNLTVVAVSDFGGITEKKPIRALIGSNFSISNTATEQSVTIVTVTETAPGTYAIVLDAQTPGDVGILGAFKASTNISVASYEGAPLSFIFA